MRAISFKLKIYIGFALLLAFMGVVAFIGYNALSGSSEGFEEYREVARKTNLLSRVQANMLMVRMNAKDYIISGDETRYEQLEEYLEKTSGFLAEASENVGDQETAEVMAEVRADLTAYDKAFDEVADGMAERERLFSEVLAVEGPVMEEKLSGIMSSASKDNDVDTAFSGGVAMRNLLLARLYTALFISSGDEAHAERVKSEFSELDGELSILDRELQDAERRALLSDVIESKERYVAAFSEYAAATYSRDRIIAERLNVLGPEIADYVGDIKLGYMAVQDDLGPRLQSENAKAVTGMLTAAGIALALAVAAAIFIVAGVTRSLNKAVDYSRAIAEGDFDSELDIKEAGAIGDLARSMRSIPETLKEVTEEFNRLVSRIGTGHLTERGDPAGFKGQYAGLISGVNKLSDVMVGYLDKIETPIMAIDNDFNVLYMNKFGAELGGTTAEQLRGTKCYDHFRTGDCRSENCACAKAMKTLDTVASETDAHPAVGDLEIKYTANPIYDDQGKLVGAIEIVFDQTEIMGAQKRMMNIADKAEAISQRLSSASEELAAQVEQVSRGSEVQRDRIGETATAMDQMNATVMEVAKNASSAAESSGNASDQAREGSGVVEHAVASITDVHRTAREMQDNMQQLGEQAESVGKVMTVISDIADQTNLLALNAAIEAARAGDAGRGFAVVADEVRKLAEKTMGATQEVGRSIQAIQDAVRKNMEDMDAAAGKVEQATGLANQSGDALKSIVELVTQSANMVEGIATASEEQSTASEQINKAIEEINRIVAETTDGMVQSSQAVQELAGMSAELTELISELQSDNGQDKKANLRLVEDDDEFRNSA
jgi:methyl-accepting chemotaxis protein